ncbi:MAG: tripartite tricarboxylate transporter substrate-binding protein [Pseudolabrys sp.]
MTGIKVLFVAGIVLAAALANGRQAVAQADKYPSKPIEIYVPFAPGGSTGLSARALAQALEDRFKVPVRVVHKPGGNTVPAVEEVMRAKPDGYTLLLDSPASSSMLEIVVPNLPFKVTDRTFVTMVAHTPMVLIVPTDSPFKTLQDAVTELRREPGRFTWTSLGGAGAQGRYLQAVVQGGPVSMSKDAFGFDAWRQRADHADGRRQCHGRRGLLEFGCAAGGR